MPKRKNNKRRANGEGSIRQRPDGRWEARYTAGIDTETGKPIIRSIYAKTQAEVKTRLRETLTSLEGKTYCEPNKITIEECVSSFLNTKLVQKKFKESTYSNYLTLAKKHIFPSLGRLKVSKLTPKDVQDFYDALAVKPVTLVIGKNKVEHAERTLSSDTIQRIHVVLHSSLDFAVKQNIIPFNPTSDSILPERKRKEMKTLPIDTESLTKFFDALAVDTIGDCTMGRHYALFALELATGLRRGEILALRWGDIDMQTGSLAIVRQLTRINGKLTFSEPKTELSKRTVKVPDSALDVLKSHYRQQCAMRLKAGAAWQDNDLVFPNELGEPRDPAAIYNYLQRLLVKAGLPKVRFHDLRHTYATIALENNVDMKVLSASLGHFSTSFTMDTYAHITEKLQEDSANKVDSVLKHII